VNHFSTELTTGLAGGRNGLPMAARSLMISRLERAALLKQFSDGSEVVVGGGRICFSVCGAATGTYSASIVVTPRRSGTDAVARLPSDGAGFGNFALAISGCDVQARLLLGQVRS
jgi:hypothetical protein